MRKALSSRGGQGLRSSSFLFLQAGLPATVQFWQLVQQMVVVPRQSVHSHPQARQEEIISHMA
jgi:hypothetical protein